jgi:(2R)-ethylmalonyl-CoA mutase
VGKVGVPISHIGDMRALFADIPLVADEHLDDDQRHRHVAAGALPGRRRGAGRSGGRGPGIRGACPGGTTQNDIIKEYLSRGTYVFAPGPSLRLITDMVTYTVNDIPKWNPINICSYHLQEAGATPVQEIAYAMSRRSPCSMRCATRVRSPRSASVRSSRGSPSSSTPGVRFVEEMCKMRAFVQLWDELTRERYGVTDAKQRRFRYGVQVNSLGLTEAQPENNVQRIVLEMLAVTLSKDARARAVQLPAWNEALGLPRPWDQQWSLRIQQVLAYESDLLEYDDLFEGSTVVAAKVAELVEGARAEMTGCRPWAGRPRGRERLHEVRARRLARAAPSAHRAGEDVVVGVNKFETTEPNPLTADLDTAIQSSTPGSRRRRRRPCGAWREERDADPARRERAASALARLKADAASGHQPHGRLPRVCPRGVTTGEWAGALREVFGEYRAPTGVSGSVGVGAGRAALVDVRAKVAGDSVRSSARSCACSSASRGWTGTATAPSRSRCGPGMPASR